MDEKDTPEAAFTREDPATTVTQNTTTTTGDPTTTVATTIVGTATTAASPGATIPIGSVTTTSPTLLNESYYHGLLPREDVQFLLKNNGDFLVRVSQPRSSDAERQIIISLMVDKDADQQIGLRHIVVRKQMGKYQGLEF
uniref:SH2 domain-containing protein n=1 Tax=Panagrolaimus sp. PS1159 TaxID=55785 RepID=A0AC35FLZ7_9BILA